MERGSEAAAPAGSTEAADIEDLMSGSGGTSSGGGVTIRSRRGNGSQEQKKCTDESTDASDKTAAASMTFKAQARHVIGILCVLAIIAFVLLLANELRGSFSR